MGTKLLHDISETAHLLSISQSTLKRLIAKKSINPVSVGGRVLFRRSDIEAYVDSLAQKPKPPKRGRPRKSYDVDIERL